MNTGLDELFNDDLNPVLRRMGERPRGAGRDAVLHGEDAETRATVWSTVAGLGALSCGRQTELVDIAERMGTALYQSPYADTVTAVDLLHRLPDLADPALVDALRDGTRPVAVAVREHGTTNPATPDPLHTDGATVTATRRFVGFAADSSLLAVIGTADGETLLALVPTDAPGVRMRRQDDVGRGDLYEVTLDRAPVQGPVHRITEHYPAVLARARVRLAGYLAGAARGGTELAAAHLKSRSAFGRPLAHQQSLAHRLAGLAAETEAVRAFAQGCARAADEGLDIRLVAAEVLALAAELARRAAAESVHLHGAYGMTESCDAQLFYRRAAVDAAWLGTRTDLLTEAGRLLVGTRTAR